MCCMREMVSAVLRSTAKVMSLSFAELEMCFDSIYLPILLP